MSGSEDRGISYSAEDAESYGTIGIAGTTYHIGFEAVRQILGDIRGMTLLDFGAGVGRSSEFLLHRGAGHVYAVDHDPVMIERGKAKMIAGIEYVLSTDVIPLEDDIADAGTSLNALVEMPTRSTMAAALKEIHRVLRRHAHFAVATTSPEAFGHKYLSFEYEEPISRTPGTVVTCHVHTERGDLRLSDTYWTDEDYVSVLDECGLRVCSISHPRGNKLDFPSTDESIVGPFVIFDTIKV